MKIKVLSAIALVAFFAGALPCLADSALSVEANNQMHDYQQAVQTRVDENAKLVATETRLIKQKLKENQAALTSYEGFGNAYGVNPWGSCDDHEYMADLTKNADKQIKDLQQNAANYEKNANAYAQQQAQIINDEAQNLQALEDENQKTPGVHINTACSDLYVQNYTGR